MTVIITAVHRVNKNPENLFFILINIPLKNDMTDPIITTGWTFVGNSPNMTSIASENNNPRVINKNKFNETISFTFNDNIVL